MAVARRGKDTKENLGDSGSDFNIGAIITY